MALQNYPDFRQCLEKAFDEAFQELTKHGFDNNTLMSKVPCTVTMYGFDKLIERKVCTSLKNAMNCMMDMIVQEWSKDLESFLFEGKLKYYATGQCLVEYNFSSRYIYINKL